MAYFNDLNTYLHQSSLLLHAYPSTRITTKYSLPRKPTDKPKGKASPKPDSEAPATPKREPSATLIVKAFEPGSGICLKYKTDKAAEVGRLIAGLGRLAKGEVIEMPAPVLPGVPEAEQQGDKMEVDAAVGSGTATPKIEERAVPGGGGGGKGKKKGKK